MRSDCIELSRLPRQWYLSWVFAGSFKSFNVRYFFGKVVKLLEVLTRLLTSMSRRIVYARVVLKRSLELW